MSTITSFVFFITFAIFAYNANRSGDRIYLLPCFYIGITFYTIIGTQLFTFAKMVPFDLGFVVSNNELNESILCFYISSIFFFIGGSLVRDVRLRSLYKNEYSIIIKHPKSITIFGITLFTIAIAHLSIGISDLYYRDSYTVGIDSIPAARVIYTIALPLSAAAIALEKKTALRLTLLLILIVFAQGTNSRSTALIPIIYALIRLLSTGKFSLIKLSFFISLSIFLAFAAMVFRNYPEQGVFGNIYSYFDYGLDYNIFLYSINYLTSFSVYATAESITLGTFNLKSFLISISPLPSRFHDIEFMIESQKINQFAPFTSIGILAQGGLLFLAISYFSLGFIYRLIFNAANKYGTLINSLITILYLGFITLSTQYNLRGSLRLVYYSILILISIKIFIHLFKKKPINNMFSNN